MRGYIIQYDQYADPPVLRMYLHHAPHKRMHRATLQQFREDLYHAAVRQIGKVVDLPIPHDVDLEITYVNGSSPDLDHLLEATFMALDGKSLKGPSVLKDDRQIQSVKMSKMFVQRTKHDPATHG